MTRLTWEQGAAAARAALELTRGLVILVVVVPGIYTDEALQRFAERAAPGRAVVSHRLDRDGGVLVYHRGKLPQAPVWVVRGLEFLTETEQRLTLASLNLSRDSMPELGAPVIFFIPEANYPTFLHHCPDLFDWRELLLQLADPEDETPEQAAWRALNTRILSGSARRGLRLHGELAGLEVLEPDEMYEVRLANGLPMRFDDWIGGEPGLRVLAGEIVGKSALLRRTARWRAVAALDGTGTRALLVGSADQLLMGQPFGRMLCSFAHIDPVRFDKWIAHWAIEGHLLIALEGASHLDSALQAKLWEHLEGLRYQHPRLSVLAVGRVAWQPPAGWEIAVPIGWGESDVIRYLRARGLDEQALEHVQASGLALSSSLLAEIIVALYRARGRLPQDTLALMEQILDLDPDPVLEDAALGAVKDSSLEIGLAGLRPGTIAVLCDLGAIVSGDRLRFGWRFLRTCMAARSLIRQGQDAVLACWREHAGEPEWEEVLRLAVGRILRLTGGEGVIPEDLMVDRGPGFAARTVRGDALLQRIVRDAITVATQRKDDVAVQHLRHLLPFSLHSKEENAKSDVGTDIATGTAIDLSNAQLHVATRAPVRIGSSRFAMGGDMSESEPFLDTAGFGAARAMEPALPPKDHMTPTARRQLNLTIRDLHDRLTLDLKGSAEQRLRLVKDWPSPATDKAVAAWREKWGVDVAGAVARQRVEEHLAEQARAELVKADERPAQRERLLLSMYREAAYTLLHRLVILRILEATGVRKARVATGGWESLIYLDFRDIAKALVRDDSEGMGFLLRMIFEDLSLDLPGVYGDVGLTRLIPVPTATLRHLLDALNDPTLDSCWTDDTTLGWIYQYWNDPDREALDRKLASGGKLANHEIASKTQLFTERYLVEWLLHNSLGPLWLMMCHKHGWTAEVEASGALAHLEAKRAAWRQAVADKKIPPELELPIDGDLEEHWKYYVQQPLPDEVPGSVPETLSALELLDPACGSGHFLIVAFDLLFALYQEEARHRGVEGQPGWTDAEIAASILEKNLHGLDIDPRAVQIAAAALWVKAQRAAPGVEVRRLNLVASDLDLGDFPADDPALVELRSDLSEVGVAPHLTDELVASLRDADHLGALLQVDRKVEDALVSWERGNGEKQAGLFEVQRAQRKRSVDEALTRFLHQHTASEDLGLRLRGDQLAKGVRFVRMLRRGKYHVVVGNPPYQGLQKIGDTRTKAYLEGHYEEGRYDLYAAFLLRGLELAREGGISAFITMRGWMSIQQFSTLREKLLRTYVLRILGDVDRGAFEEIGGAVVATVMSIFLKRLPGDMESTAIRPTLPDDMGGTGCTLRKRAGLLGLAFQFHFRSAQFCKIPGSPIAYHWNDYLFNLYTANRKIGEVAQVREGLTTSDNERFLRLPSEIAMPPAESLMRREHHGEWAPYIKGAAGLAWFEPLCFAIRWLSNGLEVKLYNEFLYGSYTKSVRSERLYFRRGVAFTTTGTTFYARLHRYPSVFGVKGRSVFAKDTKEIVASMNSALSRVVMDTLNPTLDYTVGDVNRLPLFPVESAEDIVSTMDLYFTEHESHREPSVEFRAPGPTCWDAAQRWAQTQVDRNPGTPLAPFTPGPNDYSWITREPHEHLSYALGVSLGRFAPDGAGLLDPTSTDLSHALPNGVLFLVPDDLPEELSNLGHLAAAPLREAWRRYGPDVAPNTNLSTWLRDRFFADVHRQMYENRPIHWPLSSEKRSFVAWVQLHRFTPHTLPTVLSDHVHPALRRLEGLLADLQAARLGTDRARVREAERRLERVRRLYDELLVFSRDLQDTMEKGPPPTSPKAPRRERDAAWAPCLDDGVRVQSAALWKLLEPQWKDPKRWWDELCADHDKNDDWSQTAARYFPVRVDKRCQKDPSLAVAHRCFWRYHPETAYLWEQRLEPTLGPDFRIDEPDAPALRAAWLAANPDLARKIAEKARKSIKPAPDDADAEEELE